MPPRLVLHEDPISGNCYKVRLVAAHLGLPLDRRTYDITKGETRTPAFLGGVDAEGRIPVLQVDDAYLPESDAACWYLADGSALIPQDRFERASVLRWLFWEQYHHEPTIATVRYWLRYIGEERLDDGRRAQLPAKRRDGEAALARLDAVLTRTPFVAGEQLTLADLVLYPYTHVAEEGGFALARYPSVGAWLDRVAGSPAHVTMNC